VIFDPLHCVPSARSAWTTVNIGEAFPGLQTPLSWTAFSGPCERGVRRGLRDLGGFTRAELEIPDDVDDRLLAIFYGRCAGGVDALRKVMDRIPGNSGDKFEEHILGSVRPGLPSHRILRRYPLAIARAGHALATSTHHLRKEAATTQAWWSRVCIDEAHPGAARDIFREAQDRVEQAFRRHMTVRMLGQGLFDNVQALATAHGREGCGLKLATGYGGLDEGNLIDELLRVSRDEMPLASFLAKFGFHGPAEGDVASRSWREDPRPLHRWIHSVGEPGFRPDRRAEAAGRVAARVTAERALLVALPRYRRPMTSLTLRLTRHFVVLGEVGKATFLRAFDGLRYAARKRGRELVDAGVLGDVEDVFLLTADEAFSGVLTRRQAADLCSARSRTREEYRGLRLPQAWVGPAPRLAVASGDDTEPDGFSISGIAASPGEARGRARVVLDPADVDLDEGDILVCETTDPAWTPHIYRAAALVIDIGSSMSHGAIVARELGVPCVTGTKTGTVRIHTGDLLAVDGSRGTVTVVSRLTPTPGQRPCTSEREAR
jgi:phosphohistidine swiveling domain-containing protein